MTVPPADGGGPAPTETPWRRLRRGWLRGPAVLLVLPLVVGYVVVHTLAELSLGIDGLRPERLITRLVLASIAGFVLGVVIRRRRADPQPGPDGLEVQEAVEDGRLPPRADVEAWTGALLRRRASVEAETAPTQLVLAGALVVAAIAWGATGGPWVAWVVAVGMTALAVVLRASRARRLARVDAVLMPLLDAEQATAAGPAAAPRDDPA